MHGPDLDTPTRVAISLAAHAAVSRYQTVADLGYDFETEAPYRARHGPARTSQMLDEVAATAGTLAARIEPKMEK